VISSVKDKYKGYRQLGVGIMLASFGILTLILLSGISLYGNSTIMALYFTGHISASSARLSLIALGIPSTAITGYILSTAGYVAFLNGTTIVLIGYSILDVLGIWGWIILGAIAGTAA
jgi:hypothetical protein